LRTEFISDAETREKFAATLDEMQGMAEAALSFAQSESITEPTRVVDLNALLESICDDQADLGWNVEFQRDGRLPYACRPTALRRAIRNVIENAVRYGEGARVALGSSEQGVEIVLEDDGPGIPEGGPGEGLQSLRAPRDLKKPRHWRRRPRSFHRSVHFSRSWRRYYSSGKGPGLRVHLR